MKPSLNNNNVYELNVLAVDDNPGKLKQWQIWLAKVSKNKRYNFAFNFTVAYTIQDAKKIIDLEDIKKFHVILLDDVVVEHSGAELLKPLIEKVNLEEIIIACISSNADQQDVIEKFKTEVLNDEGKPLIHLLFYKSALTGALLLLKEINTKFDLIDLDSLPPSPKRRRLSSASDQENIPISPCSSDDSSSSSSSSSSTDSPSVMGGLARCALHPTPLNVSASLTVFNEPENQESNAP